jgi:hypothetical protein
MSEVQRGSKGHRRYRMDYIPDKDLFRAVTFARSMISDGTSPGRAFRVAANYYGVDRNEVAHFAAQYAGSMGGKASAGKPRMRRQGPSDGCPTCKYGASSGDPLQPWMCTKVNPPLLQYGDRTEGCSDWHYGESA